MISKVLPSAVKIFDSTYKIEYVDNPTEVDIFHRESLWGQIDYWTRTIRIYKADLPAADIWQIIWHEILHGICVKLKLDSIKDDEKIIDLLATGINSVLLDNGTFTCGPFEGWEISDPKKDLAEVEKIAKNVENEAKFMWDPIGIKTGLQTGLQENKNA